jgi:molecular chaperone DnaK (HSP70)
MRTFLGKLMDSLDKLTESINRLNAKLSSEELTITAKTKQDAPQISTTEAHTEEVASLEDRGTEAVSFKSPAEDSSSSVEGKGFPAGDPIDLDYDDLLFGIDLGTTTTKMSYNNGRKHTHNLINIGKNETEFQMPSLVCRINGQLRVGEDISNFEESIDSRHLKLKLGDIKNLSKKEKSNISDLFTAIFKEAIQRASLTQDFPGLNPSKMKANISTSSNFDLEARELLLASARKAGLISLSLENIVEEPIAAGLAYIETRSPGKTEPEYILVCDYGGGTFDCSLIFVQATDGKEDKIEVLATAGVLGCGGAAIDEELFSHFLSEHDLYSQAKIPLVRLGLLNEVEAMKILLSKEQDCERNISGILSSGEKVLNLTRQTLEALIDKTGLLERSFQAIEWVLRVGTKAKTPGCSDYDVFHPPLNELVPDKIKILFVGGTSNIPYVKEYICEKLGISELEEKLIKKEDFVWDPMEAVVVGVSYRKAFHGIDLNRPPYKILIKIENIKHEVQGIFESFMQYDANGTNRVFKHLVEKEIKIPIETDQNINLKIYTIDSAGNKKGIFKITGAESHLIYEDELNLYGVKDKLVLKLELNGKIKLLRKPKYGIFKEEASYIAPWRSDNLTQLIEWNPPNDFHGNGHGDGEPG